jgi:hypothetical protein
MCGYNRCNDKVAECLLISSSPYWLLSIDECAGWYSSTLLWRYCRSPQAYEDCFIVGPVNEIMVVTLTEERAFWVLDRLITVLLPGDYYTPSMIGVRADTAVLVQLVAKKLPRLYTHLMKHNVDLNVIGLPWYAAPRLNRVVILNYAFNTIHRLMCLFVDTIPIESAMRVWDVFFIEGSATLFRIALALLVCSCRVFTLPCFAVD